MNRTGLDDVVEVISHWATAQPLIAAVWLFGSRVKGTAGPESDLDIAVTMTGSYENRVADFMSNKRTWQQELAQLLQIEISKIDLQMMEGKKSFVRQYVKDANRLVYKSRN